MDESVWAARSAREKVILWGLVDWVELGRIHRFVAEENASASVPAIRDTTLNLIRMLVEDGLFVVGDLAGDDARFVAWDCNLDESIERIRSEYVDRFDQKDFWHWFCWLDPTDAGVQVARALEAELESNSQE